MPVRLAVCCFWPAIVDGVFLSANVCTRIGSLESRDDAGPVIDMPLLRRSRGLPMWRSLSQDETRSFFARLRLLGRPYNTFSSAKSPY